MIRRRRSARRDGGQRDGTTDSGLGASFTARSPPDCSPANCWGPSSASRLSVHYANWDVGSGFYPKNIAAADYTHIQLCVRERHVIGHVWPDRPECICTARDRRPRGRRARRQRQPETARQLQPVERKLKAKYPNLKILLSLGGWTYSKYFSDVAASDAARKKFVSSCVDMFIKGNLPANGGYGGPGTGAGIFDGIDIDWEYPASAGGHLGNHTSAADKQNYTLLLAELRGELDAYGAAGGKKMYLTAAVPAGQDKIQNIETDKIGAYLDYANAMTYDMHGAWDNATDFDSPFAYDAADPAGSSSRPGAVRCLPGRRGSRFEDGDGRALLRLRVHGRRRQHEPTRAVAHSAR